MTDIVPVMDHEPLTYWQAAHLLSDLLRLERVCARTPSLASAHERDAAHELLLLRLCRELPEGEPQPRRQ